jgi:hypothetical protein
MITALLNQVLTRQRYETNSLGAVASTDTANYDCRIESTSKATLGQDGEYHNMNYRIYVKPTADIKMGDRIVFYETGVIGSGDSWIVKSVFTASGHTPNHLEVYV